MVLIFPDIQYTDFNAIGLFVTIHNHSGSVSDSLALNDAKVYCSSQTKVDNLRKFIYNSCATLPRKYQFKENNKAETIKITIDGVPQLIDLVL